MRPLIMKQHILKFIVLFAAFVTPVAAVAVDAASEPGKLIMTTITDVRTVVADKKGKVPTEELDESLRKVIFPVFDFAEMSKQSLGANWNKANAGEQKEFSDLFSELLANTYLSKVRKIEQTTINFTSENVDGARAVIKTNVNDKGDNVPLLYRMYKNGDKWLVYDIVIENISLASNYRSEFAGIVRKDGIPGLIQQLKEKKQKRAQAES